MQPLSVVTRDIKYNLAYNVCSWVIDHAPIHSTDRDTWNIVSCTVCVECMRIPVTNNACVCSDFLIHDCIVFSSRSCMWCHTAACTVHARDHWSAISGTKASRLYLIVCYTRRSALTDLTTWRPCSVRTYDGVDVSIFVGIWLCCSSCAIVLSIHDVYVGLCMYFCPLNLLYGLAWRGKAWPIWMKFGR